MKDQTEAEKAYYFVIRICRIKHKENNVEEIDLRNCYEGKVSALDEIPKMIKERIEKGEIKTE